VGVFSVLQVVDMTQKPYQEPYRRTWRGNSDAYFFSLNKGKEGMLLFISQEGN
jgi:hypothetical protein